MSYFIYQSLLYTGLVLYTWYRAKNSNLYFKAAWDLALILMVAGFVGGRLFHVVYENPEIYRAHPWLIIQFWNGGFVFFGGFFFALAAGSFYIWKEKENFLEWADFFSPVIAIGYSLGRLGCLIGGCCYGAFCDAPWAIEGRHPTQVYAFLSEGLLFLYLILKERQAPPRGRIFSLWLIGHGLGRLIMESFRDDYRGAVLAGFSISSWISLFVVATGSALFFLLKDRR